MSNINDIETHRKHLEIITDKNEKIKYIREIEEPSMMVELAFEFLRGEEYYYFTMDKILPDEIIISILDKIDDTQKVRLISTMRESDIKINLFDRLENQKHAQAIKRLFQQNNNVGKGIDLRILDEKYLETLGDDIINVISGFDNLQEWLLSLNTKEYAIFVKCLNVYITQNGIDNWRDGFYKIISKLRGLHEHKRKYHSTEMIVF